MLAAYLVSLIVGGGLVVFSLVAGGKDHDAQGDPIQVGDGHDIEHAHGHAGGAALAVTTTRALERRSPKARRPFLLKSTRFWTFFTAFGGATGVSITALGLAGEPLTGLLALGLGVAAGTGAGVAQQLIGKDGVTSLPTLADYRGAEAVVLIPVAAGDAGKIRIQISGGTSVDLRATTDEARPFAARAPAFVLDVGADGTARIVHPPEKA